MKKIVYILYFLVMELTLCAHATSVEGCTFVSHGIQQYELNFFSSNMCILTQLNRLSGETRIDTLEYSIDRHILYVFPKYIYNENPRKERQIISPKCRVDPYVYIDGTAIKCSPLGGMIIVHSAYPAMFVLGNIGDFLTLNDKLKMEFLSKDIISVWDRGAYYGLFKLTSGRPIYSIRPLKMKYIKMIREYIKLCYTWGYYWFFCKKHKEDAPCTLAGARYEYASSPIYESLEFLNDSLCVYALQNDEVKASVRYYCNYSILENGFVIVRRDSTVSVGVDMKTFIPEHLESSSKVSDLISLTTIDCDTFLLYDDMLYYARIYPQTAYLYYHRPPMGDNRGARMSNDQETHLLQTKVFVRTGKKKSSLKIAKFYQKYYIPINYLKADIYYEVQKADCTDNYHFKELLK